MKKGKLKGWEGIGTNKGKFVPVDDGLDYVFQQIGIVQFDKDAPEAEMFLEDLEEWYFSGNWIEVDRKDNTI